MKVIEARPDAHGVMPGNRKRPPNHRSQDSLSAGQREDVAFLCEKPGRDRAADPSEGNQNGVGPMERGENRSRDQRSCGGAYTGGEQPIGDIGVQPDLLEDAEKHVPKEASRNEQVVERAMQPAKK